MANVINVSLDTSSTPFRLSVADHGGENQVGTGNGAQTITWHLTGQLSAGNFVPIDAAQPGFSWVQPCPPPGVFGTPSIGNNGNSLSITDTHVDSSTRGSWVYMLRVSYNNTVYSTTASTGLAATVNNPIIINK